MEIDEIKPGDLVELLSVPDWLVHDLPKTDQLEIRSFVGKTTKLDEIDKFGYFWVAFEGIPIEVGDEDYFSGHSFCVTRDCLKKIA